MIPYSRQSISESDIAAVDGVLRSPFLTQGPEVPRFEAAIRDFCGAGHAVAACNATAALHIACLALGLGPGKSLWTSPVTFVASANCALYCGAGIDFVDIDERTGNMCMAALERKLQDAEKSGRLPAIVVPVHLAGLPCDLERLKKLAGQYGFRILEDASHALGATYRDERIGNGRWSDAAVFSFHPVKMIATGEGGMVLTNDADLAGKLRMLGNHGITRDAGQFTEPSHGPWYYQQQLLGYNYRLTDLQAALGTSQMSRLADFLRIRGTLADRYDQLLAGLPLQTPARLPGASSSWHLYIVQLTDPALPLAGLYQELRRRGVGVQLHYIPVHLQPYYGALGFKPGDFPSAEKYYRRAMSLPLFPNLEAGEQEFVAETLRQTLADFAKEALPTNA